MRAPHIFTYLLLTMCLSMPPLFADALAKPESGLISALSLPVNLEFSIADLELTPKFRFRGIQARCKMLSLSDSQIICSRATLAITESPFGAIELGAKLAWGSDDGALVVDAKGALDTADNFAIKLEQRDEDTRVDLTLEALSLSRIRDVLSAFGAFFVAHEVESGELSLSANCERKTGKQTQCNIDGSVSALNLNGINVAEDVSLDYAIESSTRGGSLETEITLSLRAGAIYYEPGFTLGSVNPGFFLSAADAPIDLSSHTVQTADGETRFLGFSLTHGNVVEVSFTGDLGFGPEPEWQNLDFSLSASDVAKFYSTYMQPIALDTAFSALEAAGSVYIKIVGKDNEIDTLDLRFDDIFLDDDEERFSLYGLDGEINLHAGRDIRESHIGWLGGAVYKIEFGSGRIDWASSERGLKVASWQDVTIFDGEFRMDTLEIENFGLHQPKVTLSGTLTPITLSSLTSAFGWMPLSGKLSGTIPHLTYAENRIVMDGDLTVNVFDGRILLTDLQIDQMFSTVPVLSANIAVNRLSLEELTRTFSFGNISGHLDGKIADLELQAWRPIRFDAAFATDEDDDVPHRISRQAVDNLGRLGAGSGGAVSQGWLGLIPSYSYGQLGIGCQLSNGHCLMSGVREASDGAFFILTRGGILPPWIGIKGAGRRIKWQTLVDGIKQISRGDFELEIGEREEVTVH